MRFFFGSTVHFTLTFVIMKLTALSVTQTLFDNKLLLFIETFYFHKSTFLPYEHTLPAMCLFFL